MLSDYYAAKIYKKIDTLYRKVLKLLKKRTRNADSAIFVTMESIKKIFKIGNGPSSSHTMAPRTAALDFAARNPHAAGFSVTLYGSLAATGSTTSPDQFSRCGRSNPDCGPNWVHYPLNRPGFDDCSGYWVTASRAVGF